MDVVGPISPPSSRGPQSNLPITNYFSNWVEAISLKEVKASNAVQFVKHHILYRFGVIKHIIHDNGLQLSGHTIQCFCNMFRIQRVSSMAYYLLANDFAEGFNKTITRLLKNLSPKLNMIGTTNLTNVCGHIIQQLEYPPK